MSHEINFHPMTEKLISSAGFVFTGYSELKPAAYCQLYTPFHHCQHSSLIRLYFFWEILIQEDVCLMDFLKSIIMNYPSSLHQGKQLPRTNGFILLIIKGLFILQDFL